MCRLMDITVSVISILVVSQMISGEKSPAMPCDEDWISYKDEKCLKIFSDDFFKYSTANSLCNTMGLESSLLSVNSAQEQKDFYELIFNSSEIENNIWLGIKKTGGSYVWPDGSPLGYTNWINNIEPDSDYECVEFTVSGEWSPVSCGRKNMFVCEKLQIWSVHQIQKMFQQSRKQQLENLKEYKREQIENQQMFQEYKREQLENQKENKREQLENEQLFQEYKREQLENLNEYKREQLENQKKFQVYERVQLQNEKKLQVYEKEQLENLTDFKREQLENQKMFQEFKRDQLENPVPIGFIYVQLSGQPNPQVLWPAVTWEQITTQYAGLFFRAEGLGSVAFNGGVQNENSPRLTSLHSFILDKIAASKANVVYGGRSDAINTGDWKSGSTLTLEVEHSGGEVRPRNQAIRIWKRIR